MQIFIHHFFFVHNFSQLIKPSQIHTMDQNRFSSLVKRRTKIMTKLTQEEQLALLTDMGFDPDAATKALKLTDGDMEGTVDILQKQIERRMKFAAGIVKEKPTSTDQSKKEASSTSEIKTSQVIGVRVSRPAPIAAAGIDKPTPKKVEPAVAITASKSGQVDKRNQMPCLFYNARNRSCSNGSKCPYMHVLLEQPELCQPSKPSSITIGRNMDVTPQKIGFCFMFNTKKGCAEGDSCRWLHINPQVSVPESTLRAVSRYTADCTHTTTTGLEGSSQGAEDSRMDYLKQTVVNTKILPGSNGQCTVISAAGKLCTNKCAPTSTTMCKMHCDQDELRKRREHRAVTIQARKQEIQSAIPERAPRTLPTHVPTPPAVSPVSGSLPLSLSLPQPKTQSSAVPAVVTRQQQQQQANDNGSPITYHPAVLSPDSSNSPSPLSLPDSLSDYSGNDYSCTSTRSSTNQLSASVPLSAPSLVSLPQPSNVFRYCSHVTPAGTRCMLPCISSSNTNDNGVGCSDLCTMHATEQISQQNRDAEASQWRSFISAMVPVPSTEHGGTMLQSPGEAPAVTAAPIMASAMSSPATGLSTPIARAVAMPEPKPVVAVAAPNDSLEMTVRRRVLELLVAESDASRKQSLASLLKQANNNTPWVLSTIEQAATSPHININQLIDALLAMTAVMT